MTYPIVRFGNIIHLNTDRIPDPLVAGVERYVGLEHVTPEDLHIHSWGLVADGTTFINAFRPGQVLFGKRRAYQRKVAVADFAGVCSSDIYVFESRNSQVLLPELLPFICQSEGFFQHAVGTSAGSLSPRTNWAQLAAYEFPLPPLDEQRRIAELLWAVEKEKECLEQAFGKLVELESAVKLSVFSSNINKVKLGNMVKDGYISFKTGPFGTVLKATSYVTIGVPVVNPVNMRNGSFVVVDGPFISERDAKRLEDYMIFENDLIFGRKGDIGRGIFATKEYDGFIVGSDCIRVRILGKHIAPKYLFYFLTSPESRRLLAAQSHGTTMPGINEKMLSRMEVFIIDYIEQLEIVKKLEQIDESKNQLHDKISKSFDLERALIKRFL